MDNKIYDTIIIGGGPAGYTAALYAVRAGLDALVLEKFSAGGQMTQTQQIDNYPGFDEGIDGFSLGYKMKLGAEKFGAKTIQTQVLSVDLKQKPKTIITDSGEYRAKTVMIATGADHKHLGIEGEDALIGKGVGYCAACDGMFYKGKTVAVVGGGNSAAADALLLSKICKKVYIIHRRDKLRAEKVYNAPLMKAENVEFKWNNQVKKLIGDGKIIAVEIENAEKEQEKINIDGLFISIGRSPASSLFKGQLDLDENGYIIADETTRTNIDGVFAIGDIRTKPVRQIVTAAADGASAVHFAEEYLNQDLSV
ncbi:MAG: thioredoxin-disulfide reductase [Eubacteriales bacterium]|nr:thioredoxin-disulfide reductase [Eubacteriales bacterium]